MTMWLPKLKQQDKMEIGRRCGYLIANTGEERDTIKTVTKTIELLEYLCLENNSIGVREASRILEMPKSTIQRILNSLLAKEIVDFDTVSQNYSLGNGMMRLFAPYLGKNNLFMVSQEFMDKLRDEVGETVGLHTHVNGRQMLIHQSESKQELKWSLIPGKIYPINAGASGKILLAFMSPEQYEKAKPYFGKVTERSPSEQELLEELERIRKDGYSVSRGEFSIGEMGIAVPIMKSGKILASLSIYGPESRINEKDFNWIIHRLNYTAEMISRYLG